MMMNMELLDLDCIWIGLDRIRCMNTYLLDELEKLQEYWTYWNDYHLIVSYLFMGLTFSSYNF
jgi:hypothetical protein